MLVKRLARVTAVRRGETKLGDGVASQWLADLEDIDTGALVVGALVEGDGMPLVHTKDRPSIGTYEALAGNSHKCVFRPWRWPSCSAADIANHDMLGEYETITFHLYRSPRTGQTFYTIKRPDMHRAAQEDPGAGHVHQERYLQIVAGESGEGLAFEMLGGSRRMARGGTAEAPGDGDYVRLDATTSPQLATSYAALVQLVGALVTTVQGLGGVLPPEALALLPALVTPVDGVPAVDGGDELPEEPGGGPEAPGSPRALRIVGRITTSSASTRGR
jgi:hypothetical protein